ALQYRSERLDGWSADSGCEGARSVFASGGIARTVAPHRRNRIRRGVRSGGFPAPGRFAFARPDRQPRHRGRRAGGFARPVRYPGEVPTMSDDEALVRAIAEQPEEDTPRLALADWLDEQGGEANVARAEFIRIQVELARRPDSETQAEMRQREAE